MKRFLYLLLLTISLAAAANENIVHDDGTGAQITYYLPIHEMRNGQDVQYTGFTITVIKDGKFLLFSELPGKTTADGSHFLGQIIIPSEFVGSAQIELSGSPPNSSMGLDKKMKVSEFKRIVRKKSWTEQE